MVVGIFAPPLEIAEANMNSLLRYDSWRVPGAAPPVAGRPVAEAAAEAFLPDADSEMEPQAAWRCALGDSQSLLMGDGLYADSQNGEASRGGAADTLQVRQQPVRTLPRGQAALTFEQLREASRGSFSPPCLPRS